MIRVLDRFSFQRESEFAAKVTVRAWNSADFLWIAFTLFPILLIAFILPLHPNDYWWYVRQGSDIARNGSIPVLDTISSTQAGQPYLLQPWLAAWVFWALNNLGGPVTTVLAVGLSIAAFYLFIWFTCRLAGAGSQLSSALTLLAALSGSNNWGVRPQLFAYPLFGITLYSLWRWQRGSNRMLWALPFTGFLWANLHGSFPLLFLLGGAALLAGTGDRQKLGIALAGAFAGTLANPRILGVWKYVLGMLGNPAVRTFSREWHPPENSGWQAAIFFGWLLLFPLLAARSPRKLPALHWLWFLGLGWMALSSVRNEIWFLALLAPLSAALLSAWPRERSAANAQPVRQVLNVLVGMALLLLPIAGLPGVRERWWPTPPPVLSPETPVGAAVWLAAHPELSGPIWTDLGFASYLAFALPERKLWIDPRFEHYPVEQWERYVEISEAAAGWEDLLEIEKVGLIVVNMAGQPRLQAALERSKGWCERYRDDAAVIFSTDCPLLP